MMNKKILYIVLIVVIIAGVCFGIYKISSSIIFENGKPTDGHNELINPIKSIDNTEERKNQIDFFVEQNAITLKEANELY